MNDVRAHRLADCFSVQDLPVMQYQGGRNWPPHWVGQIAAPRQSGVLKDTFVDFRRDTRCFLTVNKRLDPLRDFEMLAEIALRSEMPFEIRLTRSLISISSAL